MLFNMHMVAFVRNSMYKMKMDGEESNPSR